MDSWPAGRGPDYATVHKNSFFSDLVLALSQNSLSNLPGIASLFHITQEVLTCNFFERRIAHAAAEESLAGRVVRGPIESSDISSKNSKMKRTETKGNTVFPMPPIIASCGKEGLTV